MNLLEWAGIAFITAVGLFLIYWLLAITGLWRFVPGFRDIFCATIAGGHHPRGVYESEKGPDGQDKVVCGVCGKNMSKQFASEQK